MRRRSEINAMPEAGPSSPVDGGSLYKWRFPLLVCRELKHPTQVGFDRRPVVLVGQLPNYSIAARQNQKNRFIPQGICELKAHMLKRAQLENKNYFREGLEAVQKLVEASVEN